MTAIIDTPHQPDHTAGLPLVVIVDGDPGPLPVTVLRFDRDLHVAVVDTSRDLTDEQVYDEIDEHFEGPWIVADVMPFFDEIGWQFESPWTAADVIASFQD